MLIGYARVSKTEQDTELQMRALKAAGVGKVYFEKRSARKVRPELEAALQQLRAGDVLVIWKLDRMARSLRDLLNIVDRIEAQGAKFRSLTEHIDTTHPAGELAFHVLGAVGQFERSIIRERSIAGLEVARSNGVRFGRLPALDDRQQRRLVEQWETEKYSKTELAKMHGVSISTVKRVLWKHGRDTITDAHANGMLPPLDPRVSRA